MNQLFQDDHKCFVCGMENPQGLKIVWKTQDLSTSAEFIAEPKYQGWKGVLHGGIVATLLDEAMTRLVSELYGPAVTAEMTVRYVEPSPIGEVLHIQGEVTAESRKIIETKAFIALASGKVLAHATGKVMKIKSL